MPFALFPCFLFVGSGIKHSCFCLLFVPFFSIRLLCLFLSCLFHSKVKCCLFYCHFPLYPAPAIYSSFYTEINGQWTDFIRNNRVSYVHCDGIYLCVCVIFFPFYQSLCFFAFYASCVTMSKRANVRLFLPPSLSLIQTP